MKKLLAVFLFYGIFHAKAQLKDLSLYYGATLFSPSILQKNAQTVGFSLSFAEKRRFFFAASGFYGSSHYTNQQSYKEVPLSESVPLPPTISVVSSFSGTLLGLGASVYYQLLKKGKFEISPGLRSTVVFYSKAKAGYGTYLPDSIAGTHKFKMNSYTTNNFNNLLDARPDLLLLNLDLKIQYYFTNNLSLYAEPFVSLLNVYKNQISLTGPVGTNLGICWKIKEAID